MSSKADGLAKQIYEEVTGLSWDETVKPAPVDPPKNNMELLNRRRAVKYGYGYGKENRDA